MGKCLKIDLNKFEKITKTGTLSVSLGRVYDSYAVSKSCRVIFCYWLGFSVKILGQNLFCGLKFRFVTKISICGQHFDFRPRIRFLVNISICGQNFDFRPRIRFLVKISIFDQDFDLLVNISMSDQDFDF